MNTRVASVDDAPDVAGGTTRRAAAAAGVLFGAAVAPECFVDDAYCAAVAEHFSMIEPENALKWAAVRPSRDVFDFAPGDAVVRAARANGQRVRGHVLAWHAYNPGWLRRGRFEPSELCHMLQHHVETVAGHYAGDIFAWDVVNEVFADGASGRMRASMWYDRPGIGFAGQGTRYVEQLFRWARAAAPDALLFYNDDPSRSGSTATAMLGMVADFLHRGVPVDGVGLQLHLDLATDLPQLEDELGQFGALGVELHVTELDVAIPTDAARQPVNAHDLERQADIYRAVVAACLRLPQCTAIQTWGVDDGHSWIPTFSHDAFGAALLLDASYRRKPAYRAVADALEAAAALRGAPGPTQ